MGLNRRTFIQLSIGGTVGALFTPVPWKLIDDVSIWTQNWSWIPKLKKGEVKAVPALSKLCPSGCPVMVKTVGGYPFATEGNTENPLSKGGVDPVSVSGAQLLNSAARVAGPLKKVGEGKYESITWEDAEALLAEKVSAAGGKVAVISGDETGTANEVFSGLMSQLGGFFYKMPSDMQVANKAWNELMKGNGQLGFDLENSDFVLLLGADALESWGPTVSNQKAFDASHAMGEDPTAEYVYAGPVQNRTAAVCDQWVPVSPEGAAAFALGLAYYLIKNGAYTMADDFSQFDYLVRSKFSPSQVEKATGVKADVLEGLAKKLMSAGRPVVVPGSGFGAAAFAAGAALNLLLGRLNASGGMYAVAEFPTVVSSAQEGGKDLLADLAGGGFAPDVLMVYEANPVYALPQSETMAQSLAKAGFTVSFSTYNDETAAIADLVLPTPHSFERYDDIQTPYGVAQATYCAGAPVVAPEKDVKSAPDFVLGLAAKLGSDLGFETFEDVLKAKAEAVGADWDELMEGKAAVSDGAAEQYSLSMAADALAKAAAPGKGPDALILATVEILNIGTDYVATPPHNASAVRDTELSGKGMFVRISGATAQKFGLSEGSMVKLSSQNGECKALVHINEGVMPGVVAAPKGFGHTAWDEFSKGKGDNTNKILTVSAEPGTGLTMWAGSTVNIAKI